MQLNQAVKKAHQRIDALVRWNRRQDEQLDELATAYATLQKELTKTRTKVTQFKKELSDAQDRIHELTTQPAGNGKVSAQ